jgi:hypothetical protein
LHAFVPRSTVYALAPALGLFTTAPCQSRSTSSRKAVFCHTIAGPRAARDRNGGFCDVSQQIVQYIEQFVVDAVAKAEINPQNN